VRRERLASLELAASRRTSVDLAEVLSDEALRDERSQVVIVVCHTQQCLSRFCIAGPFRRRPQLYRFLSKTPDAVGR
jgi:hypothetical protein